MTKLPRIDQDVAKFSTLCQCPMCQRPVEWCKEESRRGCGFCACSQWVVEIQIEPGTFEAKVVRRTFVEHDPGVDYDPKAWRKWGDDFDNRLSDKGWQEHNQYVIDLIMADPPSGICDFGCCVGTYIKKLREAGYEGGYLGVDATPEFIWRARDAMPGESFTIGDVCNIHPGCVANSNDTVLCLEVLMHLPSLDPLKSLFNLADKRLIISTYGSHRETYPTHDLEDGVLNWHHNDNDILAYMPEDWQLASRRVFRRYDPPWPFHVFDFRRKIGGAP